MADMDWSESDRFKRHYGSIERVRWLKSQPCAVPSCGAVPSEAAHVRSRGAGGGPDDMIALCGDHHVQQHAVGIVTFQEMHGLDLRALAGEYTARWMRYSNS